MHKVSKMVIDYAKENKCHKIVIGDLKGIKINADINGSLNILRKSIPSKKLQWITCDNNDQ